MGNSPIKPHIENAQKTGVCSLKGMKLKELPPQISRLPKTLRMFDLSDNQLETLPDIIGQLVMLKSLLVNNNRLTSITEDVGGLRKLETLSVSFNALRSFSLASPTKMSHLKVLNLNNNKLRYFPVDACQLPNLDMLDLSNNSIAALPNEISSLSAIELNLNKNRLSELTDSLSGCKQLKVLRVEENCLNLNSITPNILKHSHISTLAFDGNLFDMKQFQELEGYDEYISRYAASKKKIT